MSDIPEERSPSARKAQSPLRRVGDVFAILIFVSKKVAAFALHPITLVLLVGVASVWVVGRARHDVSDLDGLVGEAALELANAGRVLTEIEALANHGEALQTALWTDELASEGLSDRQAALGLLVRLGVRKRALTDKHRERASCLLGRLVHDDPAVDAEYCDLGTRLWPLVPALRGRAKETTFDSGLTFVGSSSGIVRKGDTWRQFAWFVRLRNETEAPITVNVQFRWHDEQANVIDARNRFGIEVLPDDERVVFGEHVLSPEDAGQVAGTSVVTPTCLKLAFERYCLGGDRFTVPLFPRHFPLKGPTPDDALEGFMWDDDAGLGVVLLNNRIVRIVRSFAADVTGQSWNVVRGQIESTYGRADRNEHVARRPGADLAPMVEQGSLPRLTWQQDGWTIELLWPRTHHLFVLYTVDEAHDMLEDLDVLVGEPPG